jgi:hypothetical protein
VLQALLLQGIAKGSSGPATLFKGTDP